MGQEPFRYVCAGCGWEGESDWSNDEAMAESRHLWGTRPPENMVVVCDDCFQRGMHDLADRQ